MDISFIMVALVSTLQCLVLADNILEGKPSKQSTTRGNRPSQHALDGDTDTDIHTERQSNAYWEADLGGYYNVTNITVTTVSGRTSGSHIMEALIETATTSISTCPRNNDTFRCGQWSKQNLYSVSITFNCTYSAVRYVRIKRENDYLSFAEVTAEGVLINLLNPQYYDKIKSKKVTTPVKSLSVGKVTECGTMCSRTQPCIAFSFSKSQQPNCLLAIDTSMKTDSEWIGYKFNECMQMPTTCPPTG